MSSLKGPDLKDMANRLETLEDERAILRTLYQYGHCVDYGREKEWVDCFTEDATYVRKGAGLTHRGHAELARFIATHTRAPERYHKHLLVNPVITLQGDEATVESYYVRIDEGEPAPYVISMGRYHDRMVRCPDGKWRFKERRIEREANAPGEIPFRTLPKDWKPPA